MPSNDRDLAPIKLELVVVIIAKSKATFYTDFLQSIGSNFQFAAPAKGTADQSILDLLGLADQEKTAIFAVVRSDKLDSTMEELDKRFRTIRGGQGIAFSVPFSSMIGTTYYGFLTGDERMVKNGN